MIFDTPLFGRRPPIEYFFVYPNKPFEIFSIFFWRYGREKNLNQKRPITLSLIETVPVRNIPLFSTSCLGIFYILEQFPRVETVLYNWFTHHPPTHYKVIMTTFPYNRFRDLFLLAFRKPLLTFRVWYRIEARNAKLDRLALHITGAA